MASQTFKGYRCISVPLSFSSVDDDSSSAAASLSCHTFFLKAHQDQNSEKGSTLFVGNADITGTLSDQQIDSFLRDIFVAFGDINGVSVSHFNDETDDSLSLQSLLTANINGDKNDNKNTVTNNRIAKRSSKTKFAHVIFSKKASLRQCLSATDSTFLDIFRSVVPKSSIFERFQLNVKRSNEIISALRKEGFSYHNYDTNLSARKAEVFSSLQSFESLENERLQQLQQMSNQVDDDGFRVVVNKKRTSEAVAAPERARKKRQGKELKNFYRHQIREEKREKLETLRKKFDEDRLKIASLKQERKFKPF